MLPHFGYLVEVELRKIFRGVQDLVPLGVALQQRVLDPVMHHLHVVPRAAGADVGVAVLRRQRAKNRLALLHRPIAATDHKAVTVLQSPDAAARSAVHELDPLLRE